MMTDDSTPSIRVEFTTSLNVVNEESVINSEVTQ